MRFALVGCGAIAGAHADAIRAAAGADLVGGVDTDPGVRARVSETWGVPVFADTDDLLANAEVDAVCLCTPPASHRSLASRLLRSKVHVLCEKPLATSVEDARAMADVASDTGRILMVSSKFKFVGDLIEARRLIDSGAIGKPLHYEVTFCAQVPLADRWNARPEVAGGGVVMDNGCHAFDVLSLLRHSSVEFVHAAAFTHRTVSPDVEDSAEILLFTEDQTPVRVALSWTYFTKDLDYLTVQGTEGTVRVAWTGGQLRRHGEREWTGFGEGYDKNAVFGAQLNEFMARASGGGQGSDDPDAIHSIELIEEVYRTESAGRLTALTP